MQDLQRAATVKQRCTTKNVIQQPRARKTAPREDSLIYKVTMWG